MTPISYGNLHFYEELNIVNYRYYYFLDYHQYDRSNKIPLQVQLTHLLSIYLKNYDKDPMTVLLLDVNDSVLLFDSFFYPLLDTYDLYPNKVDHQFKN